MGTRADFYVGRGENAEWLGSVAWDGYPDGFDTFYLKAATAEAWRATVAAELAGRDDATLPASGWPWPWEDSRTTDYAYAFDGGRVWASCFGCEWYDPIADDEEGKADKAAVFPRMNTATATLGPRSGLIIVTSVRK